MFFENSKIDLQRIMASTSDGGSLGSRLSTICRKRFYRFPDAKDQNSLGMVEIALSILKDCYTGGMFINGPVTERSCFATHR
uniref:Uncharacterized protein n=1 Tax=Romanomermis culicivorax TaxID=13658 RepID=A0A915K6P7_ROMCU